MTELKGKPAKFSWDAVKTRRAALARSVGARFCGTPKLKPVSFWAGPICGQYLCQKPLDHVGWMFVADRLRTLAGDHYRYAIDHEWALAFDDKDGELWGVVNEPYIEDAKAESLCQALGRALDEWDVDVHLLSASESAWAPDNSWCRPIVRVLRGHGVMTFLRRTGRAISEELMGMI
jgi:hypothetical protein